MNKSMLTPTTGHQRAPTTELLSQLGAARQANDGEASAAFARLLQAKGAALSAPPAPSPASVPSAGPLPSRPGASPQAAARPASSEGVRSPTAEQARRHEAARLARQQASGASAQAGTNARPAQANESQAQDPVLAQVLRQLRHEDGQGGSDDGALAQDGATEADAPSADGSATGSVVPVLPFLQGLQGQELSTDPASTTDTGSAADSRLAGSEAGSAAGLQFGSAAELSSDPASGSTADQQADASSPRGSREVDTRAQAGARRAGAQELTGGLQPASAQDLAGQEASAARAAEAGLALEGSGPAGKGGGLAGDKAQPMLGFAGLLQQAQAGTVQERGTAGIAPGARYELQSPLLGAGFAPEMAERLSLAAAEGVQQAQLHLNPAEMGPVQVQIVVDGQQAQISFVAEQADTRAVLEKSLPELAGALREQGLTLSGGGVFSQQQQAQSGQSGQGDRDSIASGSRWAAAPVEAGGASEASPPRPAPSGGRGQGVLDLFA